MLIAQPKGSGFQWWTASRSRSSTAKGWRPRATEPRRDGADHRRDPHLQAEARPPSGQAHAARGDRGLPKGQDGAQFLQQVKRETGLALEIIQPEEEARLAVISCAPLVSTRTEQLLVVDIGGGSTELVWIDLTSVPKRERPRAIMRLHAGFRQSPGPFPVAKVVDWISVPLGVATLRDQFEDVADDGARYALMSWYFEENLQAFAPSASQQPREGFQIVGTSGTVTTVAASHLGLKRYDRAKVDGLRMTRTRSTRW
jgi:exopolyphosphatase/guanosine-5'-triphosphate,3'-diphosphate pyrophosphatase